MMEKINKNLIERLRLIAQGIAKGNCDPDELANGAVEYLIKNKNRYKDHPNLIRIMNPDDYKGHPLRKDYPRLGMKERDNFPVVKRGINKDSTVEW